MDAGEVSGWAVFVNRQYREGATVSFVLGGMIDLFLFSYLG